MRPYALPPRGSGGIYVIRLSDHHFYGGRTKDFARRWAVHWRLFRNGAHFNAKAQAVFNKHTRFEPEVLEVILEDQVRRASEHTWLAVNFDDPGCVNLSRSSEGVHQGYQHSEETKRKHRGWKHTEEAKAKCSAAAQHPRPNYRPHPHTADSRAKLAASIRDWHSTRRAQGVEHRGFEGRTHSEISKSKMAAAKSGKKLPYRKRKPWSAERKRRQAEKMRVYWATKKSGEVS